MLRYKKEPRADWRKKMEDLGFIFHTDEDGSTYWNESAYYEFRMSHIEVIEKATNELYAMCIEAVEKIINDDDLLRKIEIPEYFFPYIRKSWDNDDKSIYGRFDLVYDGYSQPKLLEFNADTPTSLVEASVAQWHWLEECFKDSDQFNSIHEALIDAWKFVKNDTVVEPVYFTCIKDHAEDFITTNYMMETAIEAGLQTKFIFIDDIGTFEESGLFLDIEENEIRTCFKLYPYEFMQNEEYGKLMIKDQTLWFEPPWKTILSNKGILPILFEMFPYSPYLVKSSFEPMDSGKFVIKPMHSREGANIKIMDGSRVILESDGVYDGKVIYQEFIDIPKFDDRYTVIGSWIIGGEAHGIGIRETDNLITGNMSQFVPHRII